MSYTTGTCTGPSALLAALKTFIESVGWTTKRYDTTTAGQEELIAMGPGLSNEDEIYIGVKVYTDSLNNYYSWKLRGYTGYSSLLDFYTQPGYLNQYVGTGTTYGPTVPLISGTIYYWFIADKRRIIVIAKCGTVFESAYLGLINPFAPESQLPYPLYIGGSFYSPLVNSTSQAGGHDSFWRNSTPSTYYSHSYLLLNSVWIPAINFNVSGNFIYIWPYSTHLNDSSAPSGYVTPGFNNIRENIDGTYPLFPCTLHSAYNSSIKGIFGELSGVYGIPKWSQSAEDTITIGSDTYLIVHSAYVTDRKSYAAIKLA